MTVREPDLEAHLAHGDHMWEEERISDRCQDGVDNDCDGVVDMDEGLSVRMMCARNSCFYDIGFRVMTHVITKFWAVCTGGDPECFFGRASRMSGTEGRLCSGMPGRLRKLRERVSCCAMSYYRGYSVAAYSRYWQPGRGQGAVTLDVDPVTSCDRVHILLC